MAASQRQRRIGGVLVGAQFGLIGLCLVPVGPTISPGLPWVGAAGLLLSLLTGALALLALGAHTRVHPVPHERASLCTTGIYAWIRHPMYTAVLLACAGIALATARLSSWVALIALVIVLRIKARFEDRMLWARFGSQFEPYATRVPAFLPAPWRSVGR